jgi:hypothetical protein
VLQVLDAPDNVPDFFFTQNFRKKFLPARPFNEVSLPFTSCYFFKIEFNGIDRLVLVGGRNTAIFN